MVTVLLLLRKNRSLQHIDDYLNYLFRYNP